MNTSIRRHIESAEGVCSELARSSQLTQLLLDELKDLLQEPVDLEDTQWIESALDQLCQFVDEEFQLQEQGGYLNEVLDEFPNWDRQIEILKLEHVRLRNELTLLRARFSQPLSRKQIDRVVRQNFREWFREFSTHKRAENELILKAHTLDVGQGE